MPFIQVKLIEDVFSAEQKHQLITKITDAFVEVEGEHMRPVTFVVIDETRSGDWGIGGKLMTTEADSGIIAGQKISRVRSARSSPV
jgi:4-oxalocrotonate tautomerase